MLEVFKVSASFIWLKNVSWVVKVLNVITGTHVIKSITIHSTHYLFSDWPKAYSEFSKSALGTSSSCRLYNNHVKDTKGHG